MKGNLGYDDVTFFRTFFTLGARDHYLVPIRGAVWGYSAVDNDTRGYRELV